MQRICTFLKLENFLESKFRKKMYHTKIKSRKKMYLLEKYLPLGRWDQDLPTLHIREEPGNHTEQGGTSYVDFAGMRNVH